MVHENSYAWAVGKEFPVYIYNIFKLVTGVWYFEAVLYFSSSWVELKISFVKT